MPMNKRQKQRIGLIIAFIILIYGASQYQPKQSSHTPEPVTPVTTLYQQKQSDIQIEVTGKVTRILADDNEGSRHQRFIIETGVGHSLLVAHNIDLAPRIDDLKIGDEVTIYGEYEWNPQGGVMHWTHHDPDNQHPHGWIRHKGDMYQ